MSAQTPATLRKTLEYRAVEIALWQRDEVVQTIPQERIMMRDVGKFSSVVVSRDMEEIVLPSKEEESWTLCSSRHRSASKNVWWNRV